MNARQLDLLMGVAGGVALGACAVYAVWAWAIYKTDQLNALLAGNEPEEGGHVTIRSHAGRQYYIVPQPDTRERGDC